MHRCNCFPVNNSGIVIRVSVPIYLLFVDYENAFNSVDRDCRWVILKNRTSLKIAKPDKTEYNNSRCRVFHEGILLEEFHTTSGVTQGCILSPILFLMSWTRC